MDPKTPKKGQKWQEQFKATLMSKWGLQIRQSGTIKSPSSRNRGSPDEKLNYLISVLSVKGSIYLDDVLSEFEKDAPTVLSDWQRKSRAERDVLPRRKADQSKLFQDLTLRRPDFTEDEKSFLKQKLEHILQEKYNLFISSNRRQTRNEHTPAADRNLTDSSGHENQTSSGLRHSTRRQSALTGSAASKESPVDFSVEQGPTTHTSIANLPSLVSANFVNDAPFPMLPVPCPPQPRSRSTSNSSGDDRFATPPESPSRMPLRNANNNLRPRVDNNIGSASLFKKPSLPHISSRKRPHAEANDSIKPRKLSRESTDEQIVSIRSDLPAFNSAEFINYSAAIGTSDNPSSRRRSSRRISSQLSPPSSQEVDSGNISITTSFASTSSLATTPNTSFSVLSSKHSFESITDTSDTTVMPGFAQQPGRPLRFTSRASDRPSEMKSFPAEVSHDESDHDFHDSMDMDDVPEFLDGQDMLDLPAELEGSMSWLPPVSASVVDRLFSKLINNPAFELQFLRYHPTASFRQFYETSRISNYCKIPLKEFASCLIEIVNDYDMFWSMMCSIVKIQDKEMPQRSSKLAWENAGLGFKGVSLSGKFEFSDHKEGPIFTFSLSPLKMEKSCRFTRSFESDRFCTVLMPLLERSALPQHLKAFATPLRAAFVKWLAESKHTFLGRTWQAFFAKQESAKKNRNNSRSEEKQAKIRLHLFAEDGEDFRSRPTGVASEIDPLKRDHAPIAVAHLLNWFMPFSENRNQLCLKLFSRLSLGLTNTDPTITFDPNKMLRRDDARADAPGVWRLDKCRSDEKKNRQNPDNPKMPVMNDGCARISTAVAEEIATLLKLDYIPSVFQGRIAGAKGIWIADNLGELMSAREGERWIEITDSQLKFEGTHGGLFPEDPYRTTLEVSSYSKGLKSSSLNFPLMPILLDRGVPGRVFKELLQANIEAKMEELKEVLDDPFALRKWNQQINPTLAQRLPDGSIEIQGGLPRSTTEQINFLVDAGFKPQTCHFLRERLRKSITAYCSRIKSRMNIELGQSTHVLMIPDPLGVLEENEVHLGFSNGFKDPLSGFNQIMLHGFEVLVARLPAHLPSDIQKASAVFKVELGSYKDVIIFSSKGKVSLASKLSGGDYDGDKAWVCWDQDIVRHFQNAEVPETPQADSYGIESDKLRMKDILDSHNYVEKFLAHSFDFALRQSLLGICSNYHESFCYHNNGINSSLAINIACLLGHLVDSAKSGHLYDDQSWKQYLTKKNLPRILEKPAYKDPKKSRGKRGNLIDDLVFNVGKDTIDNALKDINDSFKDNIIWDEDISRVRTSESEDSKSDPVLKQAIDHAKREIEKVYDYWKRHTSAIADEDEFATSKRRSGPDFSAIVEKCRADFLAIAPCPESTKATSPSPSSTLIERWIREHGSCHPSHWDLVKASLAFHRHETTTFAWYTAGMELCEIKARSRGRASYRTVTAGMYEMMRLDGKMVDKMRRRTDEDGEISEDEDELEDEFGEWGWLQ